MGIRGGIVEFLSLLLLIAIPAFFVWLNRKKQIEHEEYHEKLPRISKANEENIQKNVDTLLSEVDHYFQMSELKSTEERDAYMESLINERFSVEIGLEGGENVT
jgi:hypothetical protein